MNWKEIHDKSTTKEKTMKNRRYKEGKRKIMCFVVGYVTRRPEQNRRRVDNEKNNIKKMKEQTKI